MSNHDHHLSRRDAERLLDDPAATSSALGSALSAASAPARPGELRREDAAVAAFHTARLTPSPTSRSNFVSPSKLGSRAAARAVIATGAVVALATGGFALANSAHLPTLPGQASDQATESVAKTPKPTESQTTTTETATESPSESPATEDVESPEGSATPTPSFEGLCKAFLATDHAAHGKSLDSAAFTALATEAGGADLETYCIALVGEPKETGKPSALPTPTAKPTPGKPTDGPTGKPSEVPSPTSKPTPTDKPAPGRPTDKPTDKPGQGSDKASDKASDKGSKGSTTSGS